MKYIAVIAIAAVTILASWGYGDKRPVSITDDMSVSELKESLGEDLAQKKPNFDLPGVTAEAGRVLFESGFAPKPKGGKTKRQSKHFVCTSCHNVVKEDPDLTISDPEARLTYTAERGLPFLQGTTMYGAVSRETYYNGDYDKKYGELVKPARHDIRGAIQLCAVECAQGRALKDWELESILAYLWTIDLTVADLKLTEGEKEDIASDDLADDTKLQLLKEKYLQGSPAHFVVPPPDRKAGYGLAGDTDRGKLIYDGSCLHCHYEQRYSFFHLDSTKLSFKYLWKKAPTYHNHSTYQVVRWGVPSKSGKRSYMPQYPKEKMSEQQLADLMAYIESKAS